MNNLTTDEQWEELEKGRSRVNLIAYLWASFIVSLILLAILFCVVPAHAEIPDEAGIHCILGEARSEGYLSLLAHAEAIRNRKTLRGVYGCNADLSKEMSYLKLKGIDVMAKKAWEMSKSTSTVKGADSWGSLLVDKSWIKQMERMKYTRTSVVGHTAFYRKAGQ